MYDRKRMSARIAATLALIVLTGCASLGFEQPQTFEQRLAYAYSTHTAVLLTAREGVTARTLSTDDGRQVLALADESRTLLDAAKAATAAGDLQSAEGRLILATSILTELQNYLRRKRGSP